ncbi:MAG TPA: bifunctional demethylmenaquinone methyltransferase/2-methoxy-6-polyprenyl-1,4-benzoquinol methylase UbiE [Blastocatellia bacterium]|nr:bifunctional demethylmenaquinone methyltransferase/2-methoxy-6-polyprenyl-1,4-benzoquinol methylase UbiE [Blastocatellia bacterium]
MWDANQSKSKNPDAAGRQSVAPVDTFLMGEPHSTVHDVPQAAGKADRVRTMFAQIAHRYDFLNHALSLNTDRRWRKFTAKKIAGALSRPDARALDLCCGTGDMAVELAGRAPTCGLDFCHPMLRIGLNKTARRNSPVFFVEGDAIRTPFPSDSFDAVTIAFGLRNLEDVERGLVEIYRVLAPQGMAAILEFSHPTVPVLRHLFRFYFTRILPLIGNAISGSRFAYRYLPESVQAFPDQPGLAAMLRSVGFSNVQYYNLSGGIAAVHVASKP